MSVTSKKPGNRILPILFLLVSALVSFWLGPVPPDENQTLEPDATPWSLPDPDPSGQLDEIHEFLVRRSPWRETRRIESPSPEISGGWRLCGTVRRDNRPFALIEVDDQILRFPIGADLPGGDVLIGISDDRIQIHTDAATEIVPMFTNDGLISQ